MSGSSAGLRPGYRVVIDALAEEFEFSGLPVRGAIRRLEAEGLVIYRPNAGAQVAPADPGLFDEEMTVLAVLEGYGTGRRLTLLQAAEARHRASGAPHAPHHPGPGSQRRCGGLSSVGAKAIGRARRGRDRRRKVLGQQLADLGFRGLAESGPRLAREGRRHGPELAHEPLRGNRVDLDEGGLDERVQLAVPPSTRLR